MALPALTRSEKLEALGVIDGIFSLVTLAKDAVRTFEQVLAAELRKQWRTAHADALREVFKLLPEEIGESAVQTIEDGLLQALGAEFGQSPTCHKLMRGYIERAYQTGKKEVKPAASSKKRLSPSTSLIDRKAVGVLTQHNCFWLGERYGKHIGPKVSEVAQRALTDGLGRDALASELKEVLAGDAPADYKYWDVAASAALVRARSFGNISGMVEAGVVKYEILAMGDERMCSICGAMHGRTFSVADAKAVMDRVLDIQDPTAFKNAMPWHSASPAGLSDAQLMGAGRSIPPFHGRCRCLLVASEIASVSVPAGNRATPDAEPRDKAVREKIDTGIDTEQDAIALGDLLFDRLSQLVNGEDIDEELPDAIIGELSRFRAFGGDFQFAPRSNGVAKSHLQGAAKWYPSDWMKTINSNGGILAKNVRRGYFRSLGKQVEIGISKGGSKTAIHELGHAFEQHGLSKAETEFYRRRTQGGKLERLRDITGLNYHPKEVARKDEFATPYIGKDYSDSVHYEIVSIGLEGLLFNAYDMWHKDPEHIKFVIGVLLGVK